MLALAATAAGGWALLGRAPAHRPHVIVLLWDTTRADRLSAYGYARPTTPWLESIARAGVLFEECRTPANWTLPAHASLFTGLLPRHHGAISIESPLSPAHVTLAETLGAAGYDSILVTCNELVTRKTGVGQGFVRVNAVFDRKGPVNASAATAEIESELAARRADPARAGKPLFLFVNLMEPHLPYAPPLDLERPWRPEGVTNEEVARAKRFQFPFDMAHNLDISPLGPRAISILSSLYDAELLDLDKHCVALEALLRREGLLGDGPGGRPVDTLFVVTSDHGENLGEEGLVDHKISLSEAILRVPLVVHWPGRFEGGRRVREQVRLQDLYPTILEAAGIPFDPRQFPNAASLLAPSLAGRTAVAELAPPLSFLPEMRSTFAQSPPEKFAPFYRGLVAAIDPVEAPARRKWVQVTEHPEKGEKHVSREILTDPVADRRGENDLLGVPVPGPADREAAARLRAAAEAALRAR